MPVNKSLKALPFINSFMHEINGYVDDIYEALVDGDVEALSDSLNQLESSIKDLKSSYEI